MPTSGCLALDVQLQSPRTAAFRERTSRATPTRRFFVAAPFQASLNVAFPSTSRSGHFGTQDSRERLAPGTLERQVSENVPLQAPWTAVFLETSRSRHPGTGSLPWLVPSRRNRPTPSREDLPKELQRDEGAPKLKPDQRGTKKLSDLYEDRLVCVRGATMRRSEKATRPWSCLSRRQSADPRAIVAAKPASSHQESTGTSTRCAGSQRAGGKWNPMRRVWELRYDRVVELGLERRISR